MEISELSVRRLLSEASALEDCPTKVSLAEEAVRQADILNNFRLTYEARQTLLTASCFSDRVDLLLITFAWMVAQHDKYPGQFSTHGLLWQYKWVLGNVASFASISRSRIEELMQDMEKRYQEYGSTMNAVWQSRRSLMLSMNDLPAAQQAQTTLVRTPRDSLSNCVACVHSSNHDYFAAVGDLTQAAAIGRNMLRHNMRCSQEPENILADLSVTLLKLGESQEAQDLHVRGYRMVSRRQHFVISKAKHLKVATLLGRSAAARRMLERHLPEALQAPAQRCRYEFFVAALLYCHRLVQTSGRPLLLRLPDEVQVDRHKGRVDPAQLRDWFAAQAAELARQFDIRNGNDGLAQELAELPQWLELAADDQTQPTSTTTLPVAPEKPPRPQQPTPGQSRATAASAPETPQDQWWTLERFEAFLQTCTRYQHRKIAAWLSLTARIRRGVACFCSDDGTEVPSAKVFQSVRDHAECRAWLDSVSR